MNFLRKNYYARLIPFWKVYKRKLWTLFKKFARRKLQIIRFLKIVSEKNCLLRRLKMYFSHLFEYLCIYFFFVYCLIRVHKRLKKITCLTLDNFKFECQTCIIGLFWNSTTNRWIRTFRDLYAGVHFIHASVLIVLPVVYFDMIWSKISYLYKFILPIT